MSITLFPINNKVKNAITIINSIDEKKFPILLNHMNEKLKNEENFTPDEMKKLENSLKLSQCDVNLLITTMQYIHLEIDKYVIKPTALQERLIALNINENKADAFVKVWMSNNKEVFDDLCSGSSDNPNRLEDIKWQLSLQICSRAQEKQKVPKALLQFAVAQDKTKDCFEIEMDHEELSAFYNQLETIQLKLDSLKN